ncbi:hypothetical protein AN191_16355 [Loktanella sp. 5RATIMAR09]|uniref:hypothetical protein n=1 Tax=Loktanella sp. 5RATIMAR09 TaxID=1225655 RepID=UPI0006EB46AE|nr:hypothetical protein [Loktanella sp. 5RATIMAR09]KQI70751.1 hypothetical protein AN191_16355 [Loktanella sp. 5RATIMAR09]
MKVSRSISHGAQYTALVDLLCATIGIFVIVFALQDLEPPQALQPAPYDHLVICDAGRALTYNGRNTDQATVLGDEDLGNGRLMQELAGGGRVLVALAGDCLVQDEGPSVAAQLREIEEDLSDRPATDASPLTLFEFSPLGQDDNGADAIRARFLLGDMP